jgi:hypothetical protein
VKPNNRFCKSCVHKSRNNKLGIKCPDGLEPYRTIYSNPKTMTKNRPLLDGHPLETNLACSHSFCADREFATIDAIGVLTGRHGITTEMKNDYFMKRVRGNSINFISGGKNTKVKLYGGRVKVYVRHKGKWQFIDEVEPKRLLGAGKNQQTPPS